MLVVDVGVAGAVRTYGIGYSHAYSCRDRARKGFPAKISFFWRSVLPRTSELLDTFDRAPDLCAAEDQPQTFKRNREV